MTFGFVILSPGIHAEFRQRGQGTVGLGFIGCKDEVRGDSEDQHLEDLLRSTLADVNTVKGGFIVDGQNLPTGFGILSLQTGMKGEGLWIMMR